MSERNPNEPEELTSEKDELNSIRELILWEFNNLQGGTRLNYQQYWRARILLATMSVGFLGICFTGKLNIEGDLPFWVSLIFWILLVFLFYSYDCHVNDLLDSHQEKSNELRDALCRLENYQKYDDLKKMVLRSIAQYRDAELKNTFGNSRLRRFGSKLKSGSKKLETVLYYSIIVLILVASFASLFNSRRYVGDRVQGNRMHQQETIMVHRIQICGLMDTFTYKPEGLYLS